MARYLLDTTALIDFSKNREPATSLVTKMIEDGDELGVCAINVAEFYSGVPPKKRPVWDEFFGSLHFWDITRESSRKAGIFRYKFARRGVALSVADVLVAAVAQEQKAVIVTGNVKHYPMTGVKILPLLQKKK